jgi:RND family efflux transporter MFP subunit
VKRLLGTIGLCGLLLACTLAAGCGHQQAAAPPPPKTPEVLVSLPVNKQITDFEDTNGRLEASASVDIRARVTGYLKKVCFKSGALVKKDDLLFEIDPPLYEAEHDRAEAALAQAEARLTRLEADLLRARNLHSTGAMGREDFDRITGDRREAAAAVNVAKAALKMARVNLDYTHVRSPISGRISRNFIDVGNLVKTDDTILTNVASLDPMDAYFDVDERTFLRLERLIEDGVIPSIRDKEIRVRMGLADDRDFPYEGAINFVDNRLDNSTGTVRVRGEFPNPRGLLTPGLFIRVRVPIGTAHTATLVAEQSLGTNQAQKVLFVVKKAPPSEDGSKNDEYVAEERQVKIGRLHNGLRVIEDGLSVDADPKNPEYVVVSGLQRVRPGARVRIKVVDMPVAESAPVIAPRSNSAKPASPAPAADKPRPASKDGQPRKKGHTKG